MTSPSQKISNAQKGAQGNPHDPRKPKGPTQPPQKENLMITNPQAEIKEERVEPRHRNCKRRILNRDDSDDEIGNINENEPETKKK